MATVTMELPLLLQVIHGGPLPPVPKHIPVSTISGNTLTQLPTAITPRVIYNEKVGIIWNCVLVQCVNNFRTFLWLLKMLSLVSCDQR